MKLLILLIGLLVLAGCATDSGGMSDRDAGAISRVIGGIK